MVLYIKIHVSFKFSSMLLHIISHVSFSIAFTLYLLIFSLSLSRFGSKIVVQSANVKTTEVLPADVKEVSHEAKHITLSAYKICLFMLLSLNSIMCYSVLINNYIALIYSYF